MKSLGLNLHSEEEDGTVEGGGIVTRCTLLRSTRNKGRERIDNHLENDSTTVSWNWKKIF